LQILVWKQIILANIGTLFFNHLFPVIHLLSPKQTPPKFFKNEQGLDVSSFSFGHYKCRVHKKQEVKKRYKEEEEDLI